MTINRAGHSFSAFIFIFIVALTCQPTSAWAETDAQSYKEENGNKSIAACDRVVPKNPNDPDAHYNRGNALGRKGDNDLAITNFNEAIRLNPNYANAYYGRGRVWDKKKTTIELLRILTKLSGLIHPLPVRTIVVASFGQKKEDNDRAIADFYEAISLNPNCDNAYNKRGNVWKNISQIAEFVGGSTARYVEYDTQVAFKGDYNAVIAGSLPGDRRASWAGKQSRESGQATDRGAGVLNRAVGGAVLHRREGASAGSADVEVPQACVNINQTPYASRGKVDFKGLFDGDTQAMRERARELVREAYSKGYSSLGKKKAEEWENIARKYNLPLSVGLFDNYEDQYSNALSGWQRGLSPKQRGQRV